jgi:hypothetical protein
MMPVMRLSFLSWDPLLDFLKEFGGMMDKGCREKS